MKKVFLIIFSIVLVIGASAVIAEKDADYYFYTLPGDMNEDGEHTVGDALDLIKKMLNHTYVDEKLSDANRDGKTNLADILCVLKTIIGEYEVKPVLDERYLKESYLENFYAESIEFGVGNATSEWFAKYVDDGVEVTVNVTDEDVYFSGNKTSSDNIYFYIQPVSSVDYIDRHSLRIRCTTDGTVEVMRRGSSDSFVTETPATDANFAHSFTRTKDGWSVTVKIGYDYFGLEKEWSYGNVRLFPAMTDANEKGYTERTYEEVDINMPRWRMDSYFVVSTKVNGGFERDDFHNVSFAEDIPDTNAFADLAFLENLATIESNKSTTVTREVKAGASAFKDRTYGFEDGSIPLELIGKTYASGPIGGSSVKVAKAGYVVLEAGYYSSYDALNEKILANGWTLVIKAAKTPYNTAARAGTNAVPDLANWYVKYCEKGEVINFGKWAIAYGEGTTTPLDWESKAAYTILDSDSVYEWGTAPENTVLIDTDENTYYSVANRKWLGLASVAAIGNGRIIGTYTSGDTSEGLPGNYAVLAYSGDNGKTWTEFMYINSEEEGHTNKTTTVCDAQLWVERDSNTLHCFYIMSSSLETFEKSSAVWTFTISGVDKDFSEWEFSPHRYLFPGLLRNNIVVLSDGTWLAAPNDYMDERFTVVYASTDKGETWEFRGKAYIPRAYNYDETIIVEKEDGSLWMTVRNTSGVLLQSYSLDKGYTWTLSSKTNLYNCTTRFNFTRLASGALLRIDNAAADRKMMTAYLSYDDGATWQYSVTLCKEYSTYPDIDLITVDGVEQIHVVFDRDRYNYGRVYHTVLTEEFIKANNGKVFTPVDDFNMVVKIK